MLEIRPAKEIHGSIDLPPSADLLFLSAVMSLTSAGSVRIGPVADTPLWAARRRVIEDHRVVTIDADAWRIESRADAPPDAEIKFADDDIPWRDFCVFLTLGLHRTVVFDRVSPRRVTSWQEMAQRYGCPVETTLTEQGASLRLGVPLNLTVSDTHFVTEDAMYPLIGLVAGLGRKISFTTDYAWSSPLRHLLPAFGCQVAVKSNAAPTPNDPFEKRMKFLNRKRKTDDTQTFTVTVDCSQRPQQEVVVDLPGDEVLGSLLIAAKSLVQRGSLVIGNVCLESWAVPALEFIRRMGCKPGMQETRTSSFGSCGMVQLQSFELANRKTSCRPNCHYVDHIPSLAMIAAGATGQSVFRDLEDMRSDTPDGLQQVITCLDTVGIRHGDMPDGLVIDGGRDLDGFDLSAGFSASLSGACAIAGLRCTGTTTVADEAILSRWPNFRQILDGISEFRG